MSALAQGIKTAAASFFKSRVVTIASHQSPAQGLFPKENHKNIACPVCCFDIKHPWYSRIKMGGTALILKLWVIPDTWLNYRIYLMSECELSIQSKAATRLVSSKPSFRFSASTFNKDLPVCSTLL